MYHEFGSREVRVESKIAATTIQIDDDNWATAIFDAYSDPPKLTLVLHKDCLKPEDIFK